MIEPAEKFLNVSEILDPGAPIQRVSQRPGSIPIRPGERIPDALRAALDADFAARVLRQIAIHKLDESEK